MNIDPEERPAATQSMKLVRKELEHCQLQLSECRQRLKLSEGLFANIADSVFVTTPDGQIIEVNPAACALLGYAREELLTMFPWQFVTSASREEILRLIQSLQPGSPATVQRTYCSKRGELKIMDLRLTRCDLAGRDLIIVSCRDVTEQKRMEERLRRSEKNLAEGQRLTKTGSWILDFKTGNTDWSVETCRIFGFPDPPPSPHYHEFRARVRPEDREGVDRGLRESFETGEPRPLKYVFILPDGARKHIETISEPVRDETGELRLMGTVMDITDRVKAAEALRASEHLARGQLAALTKTLDSLAQESDPDKLPKHVVTTLLNQMSAHSATIWERNGDALDLIGTVEEGQFKTRSEAGYFGGSLPVNGHAPPLWIDGLHTGEHIVIEDINKEPARIVLADGQSAGWHQSELTTPFAKLKFHLTAQGVRGLLISPMMLAGKLAGIIGIRFTGTRVFGCDEIELTKALAHQAMLAMQLMRLSRQSREAAVIAERNRVARDIHDTLAQGFTGVIMQLEAAKGAVAQGDPAEAANRIERASELARSSLGEARRSVRALRPRSLRGGKLSLAIDDLLKRMTDGTGLNAEFRAQGDGRTIPAEHEEGLLRIAQEALTNAIKHAKARTFNATLNVRADIIQLQLVDDGRGFDPQMEHDGFGLIGMKERVDRMKGEFIIRSKPGAGTEILVVLKNQPATKLENGNDQG